MCWLCRASSTLKPLLFSDFSETAGWRRTRWTHETYTEYLRLEDCTDTSWLHVVLGAAVIRVHLVFMIELSVQSCARHQDLYFPILLAKVLGLRLECVMVDVLHAVDQGVGAHIVGNIFWLVAVVYGVFGGSTTSEKIKHLHSDMKQWARRTRCTNFLQGELTEQRVRTSGKWPKLKAKAAHVRHLSRYALDIVLRFGARAVDQQLILSVIQMLVRFYEVLDAGSMFLDEQALAEIRTLGPGICKVYAELSSRALASKLKFWKMAPKFHIFCHLCEWQAAEWGNPRFYWTYADEDLVGLMIDIAQTCHPKTLAVNALFKWLHLVFDAA
jgi:hypothetical protein